MCIIVIKQYVVFIINFFVAPNVAREVLVALVNFLAYFEAEENNKEEIEAEVQNLKHQTIQNEKRLVEEERYLDKCRQVYEAKMFVNLYIIKQCYNSKMKRKKLWEQNYVEF